MVKVKKFISIGICLLITLSLAIGCDKSSKNDKEAFKDLLKDINVSREEFMKKSPPRIDPYIDKLKLGDEGFTDDEIKLLIPHEGMKKFNEEEVISNKAAVEDVEYLFRLFKYGYAAYWYFGGEEFFDKAKCEILAELNGKENIKVKDLIVIMKSKLTFIKDGHFNIGQEDEFNTSYFYKDEEFKKDNKGFYKVRDGVEYRLKSIDGNKNINEYMKLTANKEGKLVYLPYIRKISKAELKNYNFSIVENEIKIDIVFESKNGEVKESKIFKTEKQINYNRKENLSVEISDDIPVLTFYECDDKLDMKKINEAVEKLKGYKVNVIDLRGNPGGSEDLGLLFCEKYMGAGKIFKYNFAKLQSKLIIKQEEAMTGKITENIVFNSYYKNSFNTDMKLVKNDKITFVLMDRNVASSGEGFIRYLSTMENVVLVGTNTEGANLVINSWPYKLPNTSIKVNIGSGIKLYADIDKFELNGFDPNIYCDSVESLDVVKKLVKFYGLNKNEK